MIRLALLSIALLSCAARAAEPAKPEKPAVPTLEVTTLDGKKFDLSKERGHWVIVNYWATWCGPCRKEMPDLSKFDADRKDVGVIGLAFEDTEVDDIKKFLAANPVSYPVAHVDTMEPPKDFDTPRGLPMTYLIAPDGHVAERFLGPVTSEMLAASIAKHGK
jgi:thiol-disulfide isomerase/thioredoxin